VVTAATDADSHAARGLESKKLKPIYPVAIGGSDDIVVGLDPIEQPLGLLPAKRSSETCVY
jgi:hypothetical protein